MTCKGLFEEFEDILHMWHRQQSIKDWLNTRVGNNGWFSVGFGKLWFAFCVRPLVFNDAHNTCPDEE